MIRSSYSVCWSGFEAMKSCAIKVSLVLLACASLNVQSGENDTKSTNPNDPAAELDQKPASLTAADEKTCRELFKQLASEEFDVRDQALSQLISRGPAVLPLATEYAKDADAEIATQAKSLYDRMICSYDGYLPLNPALRKALLKKVTMPYPPTREDLVALSHEQGITLVFDTRLNFETPDFGEKPRPLTMRLGDALKLAAGMTRAVGMPRGDVYLFATPDTAEHLARARRTFDWSLLQLDRDAATDLVAALQMFFPQQSTEMHAGGEMLVLQGIDGTLPRMKRVIALLTPGAPDAAWPAPEDPPETAKDLEQDLCAPVSINVSTDSPIVAVSQLSAHLHPAVLVSAGDPQGDPVDLKWLKKYAVERRDDPVVQEFQDLADIKLKLRDIPLGLALRWIERRSKFLNDNQFPRLFAYDIGPGSRVQFRVIPKPRPELDNAVGGADVAFLYPAETKFTWTNDKDQADKIWKVLEPHLQLFPSFTTTRGLAVIHGRLLISAPWATAQRAVELVREWRETGKPPAPPEWYTTSEQRLASSVDWDGSGLTGGRLLSRLTELSGMNFLMEDSPDGHAPDFKLTSKDAALLPPGKHTVRELLDDLATRVNADWSIQLGAIVLMPRADAKDEKTADKNVNGF